jgi:hypothetical protein
MTEIVARNSHHDPLPARLHITSRKRCYYPAKRAFRTFRTAGMETNLRPMTLGEILDRTAQLYRTNFLLFAGIASVYAGVLLVVGLAQTGVQEWMLLAHMTRQLLWMSGVWVLITWIAMFIFGGIAVAANNRAVAWVHLGEPATIRGAYQSILPKIGRYLWLGFLKLVFAWSPVIVLYAGFLGTAIYFRLKTSQSGSVPAPGSTSTLAIGIVLVALIFALLPAFVYGVVMGLRYALAVPACVVENLKARGAIRRSIELSQESRARIFVLWLLVAVIEFGLAIVTQGFFFVETFRHRMQLPVGYRILQQFVGFCTNTFVHPMLATGLTLFYYDQRVRKEGYDIEWMMQAAGMTIPAPGAPDAIPATIEPADQPLRLGPPEVSAGLPPEPSPEPPPDSWSAHE